MTIDEAFKFVSFISNKTQSGTVQPSRFNIAATRAQMQMFEKEYALWQSTQNITDNLSVFLTPGFLNVPPSGQVAYPTDYAHLSSARSNYFANNVAKEVGIKEVNNDEIESYTTSQIVTPTNRYPVMSMYDTYIRFLPKNIGGVNFDYLRLPTNPNWDYNVVNNAAVYNDTATPGETGAISNDFEFPDIAHNEICFMICSFLGINLREQQLFQYSELMKQQQA